MAIEVRKFEHSAKRLWPLVGPWVTSRSVHRELGGPVLSGDGTTWFVALDGAKPVGFMQLRDTPTAYWRDAAYVVEGFRGKKVHQRMVAAAESHLSSLPPKPVKVVCRTARWKHYARRGFKQTSQRGDWIYGEKSCSKK